MFSEWAGRTQHILESDAWTRITVRLGQAVVTLAQDPTWINPLIKCIRAVVRNLAAGTYDIANLPEEFLLAFLGMREFL